MKNIWNDPRSLFNGNHFSSILYIMVRAIFVLIIGERAKRARHSQVCSIENRIYIIYYILEQWFPLWGERAHSLKLFCMYDKRLEI